MFGEAPKVAVAAWYRDAGYEPLLAFDNAEADTAAARLALDDATAAVDIATIARDSLIEPVDLTELRQNVESATAAKSQAEASLAAVVVQNGPTVPLGEAVFLPQLPARVGSATPGASDPRSAVSEPSPARCPIAIGSGSRVVASSSSSR